MANREVRIEQLNIRLRGVSAEDARMAVSRLGPQVLELLARQQGDSPGARSVRIDALDLGTVKAPGGTPGEIGTALARRIGDAVRDAATPKGTA